MEARVAAEKRNGERERREKRGKQENKNAVAGERERESGCREAKGAKRERRAKNIYISIYRLHPPSECIKSAVDRKRHEETGAEGEAERRSEREREWFCNSRWKREREREKGRRETRGAKGREAEARARDWSPREGETGRSRNRGSRERKMKIFSISQERSSADQRLLSGAAAAAAAEPEDRVHTSL